MHHLDAVRHLLGQLLREVLHNRQRRRLVVYICLELRATLVEVGVRRVVDGGQRVAVEATVEADVALGGLALNQLSGVGRVPDGVYCTQE